MKWFFNAKHIISKYKIKEDYTDLSISSDKINNHFDKNKLSDIFNSLKEGNDKFSIDTLNELNNKCPLSLQMTFLKYFKCKNISILETYMLDLKLLKYCCESGNMKEGIRGVMIDKEYIPAFKPHSYKEVDIKLINKLLKI
ncbi:enoyl-CoA hydratase/isomerase family protein [Peptoniphilus sp. oral taxon 386]|uniref:enoyl-CoA hydratase/isomerase family protein n=1 Tax=Peptoniphilus sp. oral taxon 386 TaxID=652713 RepID=UPI0002D4EA52|nr:enoyl-CoA hydratase/isomerase family protein [Peptoniphilus sp. oral taxon 386]